MITLVLVLCIVFAVIWKLTERYRHTMAMLAKIPTIPWGWPLIGHGHMFIGTDGQGTFQAVKKLCDYVAQNGDTGVAYIKMRPHVAITNPDDAWIIFNEALDKGYIYKFLSPWLGDGLFIADAAIWHPYRKMLSPAFHPGVISSFQSIFERNSRNLCNTLQAHVGKGPFNVCEYMEQHFLETVYETSLGTSKDEGVVDEDYAKYSRRICEIAIERTTNTYLHFDFIFNRSKLKQDQDMVVKLLHDASNKVINKRKSEYINNNDYCDWTGQRFKPFLKHILELSHGKGAFTEVGVREQVDNIILAGQDTSALVMQFILILLGSHHHVQDKVYAEIEELSLHEDQEVTMGDLKQMKYIDAVINEALRLYPIGPFVPRDIKKDIKLSKYTLPAGSTAFISVWHIHRAKQWGPDVETFRPERWLDSASLPDPKTHFGGFSIGKRNCVGKLYAMCSMKTAIVHLIRKYRVYAHDAANLKLSIDIMLRPVEGNLINLETR